MDFTITIISGKNGSCYYDSGNGKYLVWDRENIPYNKTTGIYNSASIELFHELCHAWKENTKSGNENFIMFVYKNHDLLDMVYDTNKRYFNDNNMARAEFYIEQFVTELEKIVAKDLESTPSRGWYFELDRVHEVKVNSVFESGRVE